MKGRMLGRVRVGRRMLETASAVHVTGAAAGGDRNGERAVDGNRGRGSQGMAGVFALLRLGCSCEKWEVLERSRECPSSC